MPLTSNNSICCCIHITTSWFFCWHSITDFGHTERDLSVSIARFFCLLFCELGWIAVIILIQRANKSSAQIELWFLWKFKSQNLWVKQNKFWKTKTYIRFVCCWAIWLLFVRRMSPFCWLWMFDICSGLFWIAFVTVSIYWNGKC